ATSIGTRFMVILLSNRVGVLGFVCLRSRRSCIYDASGRWHSSSADCQRTRVTSVISGPSGAQRRKTRVWRQEATRRSLIEWLQVEPAQGRFTAVDVLSGYRVSC